MLSGLTAAVVLAAAAPASAVDLKVLGKQGQWTAYSFDKENRTVCYMASAPTRDEGNYSKRGKIYALVTNDPTAGTRGEVNFVSGYTYQKDSTARVTIGGAAFDLLTAEDRAWTRGPEDDLSMVQAMVKGSDMIVRGVSSRGTETKDTYSLIGFTATKKIIDTKCPE